SLLMRKIVGPLRNKYALHFLDFLKPDFQGAVLAAMAVAPEACRELFQAATWDIAWQLLRHANADVPFAAEGGAEPEPELGLADRVEASELSLDERGELQDWLTESGPGVAFGIGFGGLSERVSTKLLKVGLSFYARAHR